MNSPSQLIWRDAGKPDSHGPVDARCFICGASCLDGGELKSRALSATFNDWDYTRHDSDYLCSACCWMMNGKPPNTFRMWSLLYRQDSADRGIRPLSETATKCIGPHTWAGNKADLRPILDTLLEPPPSGVAWACALADSGKVHVYPFTKVNMVPDRWETRIERAAVASTPRQLASVVAPAARLLEVGFSKKSILSGSPHPAALLKAGVDMWRRESTTLKPWRNSHLLELALFCMRKETCGGYTNL